PWGSASKRCGGAGASVTRPPHHTGRRRDRSRLRGGNRVTFITHRGGNRATLCRVRPSGRARSDEGVLMSSRKRTRRTIGVAGIGALLGSALVAAPSGAAPAPQGCDTRTNNTYDKLLECVRLDG